MHRRRLIALACFSGALATSSAAMAQAAPRGAYGPEASMHPSDPGEDWREVEVEHTSLDKAMVIPGAVFLGAGWLANWLTALTYAFESAPNDVYLPIAFIPIVGPIADAAMVPTTSPLTLGLHVAWCVVQAVGLTLAIVGTVRPRVWTEVEWQRVTVAPSGPPHGAGLTARLVF